jgi:hypothetical protein
MAIKFKLSLVVMLALLIGNMPLVKTSKAAEVDIAEQPCDTQYWKQMSARAWMEAEREIMMNQNLIFKPDSVLEYTCFDRMARLTAHKGGDTFTHTTYFGQPIIQKTDEQGLPKSINKVVYAVLEPYIQGNYSHDFLGGRAQRLSIDNKDSQIEPPLNPLDGDYVCNYMANVWKAAKCANFVDNAAFEQTDGFYPFEGIKGHNGTPDVKGYDEIQETRIWPTNLSCAPQAGPGGGQNVAQDMGPAGSWEAQIRLSANIAGGGELYPFKEPLKEVYQDVFKRIAPQGEEGVDCSDQPPIATGITVYDGSSNYKDGVCTNPGCAYVRGNGTGLGTCEPI